VEWQKALEEAELAPAAAVVPFTLGELPRQETFKLVICVISSQYFLEHEQDLLAKII